MTSVKTRAEYLNLIVYIEGEVVPAISATVTLAVHGSATCYIQIIGTDAALNFRPRSIVEVYTAVTDEARTLDEVKAIPLYRYNGEAKINRGVVNPNESIDRGELGIFSNSGYRVTERDAEAELNYDLLFMGELSGYTFYEDSQSRNINLLCIDFANHLDTITQYTYDVNNPATMGGVARQTLASGFSDSVINGTVWTSTSGGTKLLDPTKGDTDVLKFRKAAGKDQEGTAEFTLDTIVGGVIGLDQRIVKLLGELDLSLGMKAIFNSVAKSYVFYRDVDEEFNLRDHIYIADDPTAAQLYRQAVYIDYIFGYQSRYGTLNSLKNLIKIVFKLTHYEFVPIPGMPFVRTKDFDQVLDNSLAEKQSAKKVKVSDLIAASNATQDIVAAPKSTLIKPELCFAEPPACNVIFPDEMYSINVSRHFLSEPTRGVDSTDHVIANEAFGTAIGAITDTYAISPSLILNEDGEIISYAPREMVDLANGMGRDLAEFSRILLPEEVFKGILPLDSKTGHLLRSAYLSLYGGDNDLGDLLDSKNKDSKTLNYSNLNEKQKAKIDAIVREARKFYLRESNYKFLKARYQNRAAQLSCKYLPRLVPGFPALVTEKVPRATPDLATSNYLGHFGHIIQITHFVSQGGGVTSVQLSHARPTNEALDVFIPSESPDDFQNEKTGRPENRGDALADARGEDGSESVLADLREMGVVPWGTAKRDGTPGPYHPENMYKKYAEWLGGMTWKGDDVDDLESAVALNYLGVLPITWAIAKGTSILNSPEAKKYKQATTKKIGDQTIAVSEDRQIKENYLNILREMLVLYQRNVAASGGDSVEAFYAFLGRRPVANKLQVRGYLNAYFSNAKHVTEKSKSAPSVKIRAIQKFLVNMEAYAEAGKTNTSVQVDGNVGPATKAALRAYQTFRGLPVTGAIDEATEAEISKDIETSGTSIQGNPAGFSAEDKDELLGDVSGSNSKIIRNRRFRREKRHQAVLIYLESINRLGVEGKGFRG